ncbi:uncharacterized protein PgNI_02340 [Pyricularia grisea]|uniref:Major facilitator superfamily (MFS) profile domain-containing protein n=1 Tax=Pyricularia grisea TaxID=148305 RepID=A0A6P8BNA9_PYRGI|nr:uncharacterized protein PgNI_02340 [Pyricularia grisea]TLD17935.1 hypothetical protein PgNI_02340 [Pyricularia grisea]
MSNDNIRPAGQAAPQDGDQIQTEKGPEASHLSQLHEASIDDKVLRSQAAEATEQEHSIGLIQGFKTYKRAAFWSTVISSTVIMEGYDVTLIGNFFGYPEFRKKYGEYLNERSGYQISSQWQQAFNITSAFANIIGALLNGYFTSKYGHRMVLIFSLASLACFVFISFFAPNVQAQLAGQILCNIPWGVFATTGPAYAAEVTPLAIRGYLTAYVNLCWVIGQFLSTAVLAGLVNRQDEWGYRIPFALQWIWPIPLILAAWFAPESPWHLVRTGQLDKAKRSLARLSEPHQTVDLDATVAMMVHTNKLEMEERQGTSYWDAFRGTNRRRTEIACMSFLSQITNGGALCYSGTFFFQQAGVADDVSYYIGVGGKGVAFIGTVLSWGLIYRFGRRTIWIAGFTGIVMILWTIGFLAVPTNQTLALSYAQSFMCVVWLGLYSLTVGPIVYTIVSEIGSTRLRTQTVVLARTTYYLGNVIGGGTLQPKMLAPGDWNLKGKTAFFWAGLATLTWIWGYFRMFETKDRTFGEMDVMFQRGISARKSAKYELTSDDMFLAQEQDNRQGRENVKN